jgi:2-(1,2-epoxy-1,2-dihydrophenyl)acetyl-CoA isomerase
VPSTSTHVSAEVRSEVLCISLDRAEKRNALNREMIEDLCRLVRWAGHEPGVRSLLLGGNGTAFCAGDDLDGLGPIDGTGPSESTELDAYQPVVFGLLRLRKPSVACVHGAAFGGGMEIALACDLRIGGPAARFGPATTTVGGASFTTLLPLYVGIPRARRILYFSDPLASEELFALGLIDELVPEDKVHERAEHLAAQLAEGPTRAYGLIKQSLFLGMAPQLFSSFLIEEEYTRISMSTADAKEGAQAKTERRPPRFTGE